MTEVKNLGESLRYVVQHQKEHRMADQRYDVPDPSGKGFVFRVWRPFNKPVLDEKGKVKQVPGNLPVGNHTIYLDVSNLPVRTYLCVFDKDHQLLGPYSQSKLFMKL